MAGAAKLALDICPGGGGGGETKTAWNVLSGVANLCVMFCPGCQKMAGDVLSHDVLSYIQSRKN